LAYLASFGSDDEHLSFIVAACARPMIAGDNISPAAAALDDCKNVRRLTDIVFMARSPRGLFVKACCRDVFLHRR
jgi:hypothetical protein